MGGLGVLDYDIPYFHYTDNCRQGNDHYRHEHRHDNTDICEKYRTGMQQEMDGLLKLNYDKLSNKISNY